jgi:acyl carrier protein
MNNLTITPEKVRNFLLARYAEQIRGLGRTPAEVPDHFDFLAEGIVDSFGIIEMVGAVEKEFGMELDMSGIEAEEMTILGPLTRYVVAQAGTRPAAEDKAQPFA